MKRMRGVIAMEAIILLLWLFGGVLIAKDYEHCPEQDGKIPVYNRADDTWDCKK